MSTTETDVVSFTQMKDGRGEDYDLLLHLEHGYNSGLCDRLLESLRRMDEGLAGYQISRLGHSLQSATRAEADGADIDMIVGALIHDIGDELAPDNQWYQSCVDFCENWDQASFDPAYPTKPLEYFEPMLREVFTRKPFDPDRGCL